MGGGSSSIAFALLTGCVVVVLVYVFRSSRVTPDVILLAVLVAWLMGMFMSHYVAEGG